MKKYDASIDKGNTILISSKSHPSCLVQKEISQKIEDTKIYFITNEGADDYIKHCKDLGGECKTLSDIDDTSFKTPYTVLDITDNERLQNDFSDKLYNALKCIWVDIQSVQGKKTIYLNNLYLFFDERYRSNKTVELLLEIFKNGKKYGCSIVIFNWKPIDCRSRYFDADNHIDYTASVLSQFKSAIITAIDDTKDIQIVSDVFHLTEKEEKEILSLNENEGMLIFSNKYELVCW